MQIQPLSDVPTAPPWPEAPIRGAEAVTSDGRSLPLVAAKLSGEAQGGLARLVLEQRFENRHAETLHVTYRMPLPAEGAVSGYAFEVAGRTIVGRVDRKRDAREAFERAVAAGHTAALLEQERADLFTQQLGNLPAGAALVARITIDLRLTWLPEGEWELRFPTVIGPRYVGPTDLASDARDTAVATALGGVAARIQIGLVIGDALRGKPGSPSHALRVTDAGPGGAIDQPGRAGRGSTPEGERCAIELRELAGAKLDRDLVVRWPVAGAAVGLALQLVTVGATAGPYGQGRGEHSYGLVTLVPPARDAHHRGHARDLIVLIDTSGSMAGAPLAKAKQVTALLIGSLGAGDRLELIEFASAPRRYQRAPVDATPDAKRAALRWLDKLEAGGGTEMHAAVLEAMRELRPDAQRQVVLISDGYMGGEARVIRALRGGLPRPCRLHFVGVGSSVNRALSSAMARAGRGAEVVCDLGEDAERAAHRLIARTRLPILTDVSLDGDALIAQAQAQLPDVFEGAPLVAAVRLRAGELIVRGMLADGPWQQRVRIAAPEVGHGNAAIATLFGRERVADLEAGSAADEPNDAQIELLGLSYQIATRFTSWVAIDEARATTGPARHEDMPQELPFGTTAAAFGLRAGSGVYRLEPARPGSPIPQSGPWKTSFAAPAPQPTAPLVISLQPTSPYPKSPQPTSPQPMSPMPMSPMPMSPEHEQLSYRTPVAKSVMFSGGDLTPRERRARRRRFALVALVLGVVVALLWWLMGWLAR